MRLHLLAAAALTAISAAALSTGTMAQTYGTPYREQPTNLPTPQGDSGPGGLTAHDVVGKRLLDPNGAYLGHIDGVNGSQAVVSNGRQRFTIDMGRLALGNGPATVVAEEGRSDADSLNQHQLSNYGAPAPAVQPSYTQPAVQPSYTQPQSLTPPSYAQQPSYAPAPAYAQQPTYAPAQGYVPPQGYAPSQTYAPPPPAYTAPGYTQMPAYPTAPLAPQPVQQY